MSYKFSSENSNLSLKSNTEIESSFNSHSRTLEHTGTQILNNSYPILPRKSDATRENETYAYLEKLKNLNIYTNKIEHIHHQRHLNIGEDSFAVEIKDFIPHEKSFIIKELKYKPEDIFDWKFQRLFENQDIPKTIFQHQIKFYNKFNEIDRYGILVFNGLVLTLPFLQRNDLKMIKMKTTDDKTISVNKFGVFVTGEYFTIFSVDKLNSSYQNIYVAFKLNPMDTVIVPGYDSTINSRVIDINLNFFAFNCSKKINLIIGTPIFSNKWEIQGIYSHSVLNLHYAYRFEPIIAYVLRNQQEINNPQIDNFLDPYTKINKRTVIY